MFLEGPEATHPQSICLASGSLSGDVLLTSSPAVPRLGPTQGQVWSQTSWVSGVEWKPLSCDQLFATPWTVAYQAPLSMELRGGPKASHGLYKKKRVNSTPPNARALCREVKQQKTGSLP